MMFVHSYGAHYTLGEVVVVVFEIKHELRHGTTGASACAEHKYLIRALKRLGNCLVEGFEFRLSLAIGVVLVVVQRTAVAVGVMRHDTLRHRTLHFGFINACLAMIDDDKKMNAVCCVRGIGRISGHVLVCFCRN